MSLSQHGLKVLKYLIKVSLIIAINYYNSSKSILHISFQQFYWALLSILIYQFQKLKYIIVLALEEQTKV